MDARESYAKSLKALRWFSCALILLAFLGGVGYLALSVYFYLGGQSLPVPLFVISGTIVCLVSAFCFCFLAVKDRSFVIWSFYLSGFLAVALILLLLFFSVSFPESAASLKGAVLGVGSGALLLVLGSFVFPSLRLVGRSEPNWCFFLVAVLELLAGVALFVFSFFLDKLGPLYLLLMAALFLRAAQYLALPLYHKSV
jgi:hypothetical protein